MEHCVHMATVIKQLLSKAFSHTLINDLYCTLYCSAHSLAYLMTR